MSVCPSSEESNGFNFPVINKILGTSVKKSTFYTIQDDLLAYLAGSGVVVCKLNKEDGKITSQRFFCVNSNNSSMNSSPGVTSSANAYLNMIRKDGTINSDVSSPTSYEDTFRDSFGYPSDPIITGSSSESHTNTKDSDNLDVSIPVQSPSSSKFKDRVRSINCLSISPDKTVLAIGEIGYHPRIALFSLAPDLLSSPFALIYEHSFGINSISFSSDLKTFASLGLINDGFLNIWKIQSTSISLQASNKCTSVVNKMIWHENYIITLGLRMIKVWKSEKKSGSNNSVTGGSILKGKNVLLGSLINCNFISGDSLSSDEFLIMTESNILLLKLNYEALTLVPLDLPLQNFHSLCIDYDNEQVWFDSTTGLTSIPIGELKETKISSPSKPSSPTKLSLGSIFSQSPTLDGSNDLHKIINFNEKFLIFLSEEYEITLFNKFTRQTKVLIGSLIKNLSGIKASYLNEILVFSNEGVINKVELDSVSYVCKLDLLATEVIGNSLTAVDMKRKLESGNSDSDSDSDSDLVVCGDKFGTVYVSKLVEGNLNPFTKLKPTPQRLTMLYFSRRIRVATSVVYRETE